MMVCMMVPFSSVCYRRDSWELKVDRITVSSVQAARAGGFIRPKGNELTLLMGAAHLSGGLRKRSATSAVLNLKRRCHDLIYDLQSAHVVPSANKNNVL